MKKSDTTSVNREDLARLMQAGLEVHPSRALLVVPHSGDLHAAVRPKRHGAPLRRAIERAAWRYLRGSVSLSGVPGAPTRILWRWVTPDGRSLFASRPHARPEARRRPGRPPLYPEPFGRGRRALETEARRLALPCPDSSTVLPCLWCAPQSTTQAPPVAYTAPALVEHAASEHYSSGVQGAARALLRRLSSAKSAANSGAYE